MTPWVPPFFDRSRHFSSIRLQLIFVEDLSVLGHLAVVIESNAITFKVGCAFWPGCLSSADSRLRKFLPGTTIANTPFHCLERLHVVGDV